MFSADLYNEACSDALQSGAPNRRPRNPERVTSVINREPSRQLAEALVSLQLAENMDERQSVASVRPICGAATGYFAVAVTRELKRLKCDDLVISADDYLTWIKYKDGELFGEYSEAPNIAYLTDLLEQAVKAGVGSLSCFVRGLRDSDGPYVGESSMLYDSLSQAVDALEQTRIVEEALDDFRQAAVADWLLNVKLIAKGKDLQTVTLTRPAGKVIALFNSFHLVLCTTIAGMPKVVVTSRERILNLYELHGARLRVILYSLVAQSSSPNSVPKPDIIRRVFALVDQFITRYGFDGYQVVKLFEPIMTGMAHELADGSVSPLIHVAASGIIDGLAHRYAATDKQVAYLNADGIVNQRPAELVQEVDNYLNGLREVLAEANTVTLFSELHGLARSCFGYGAPINEMSFQKARTVMTNRSVLSEEARRYLEEAAGCLRREFALSYFDKHGRLPPISAQPVSPPLQALFSGATKMRLDIAKRDIPLRDWAAVRYEKCLDFTDEYDMSELIQDKAIAPPLSELHTLYSSDSLGWYPGLGLTTRRLVLRVLGSNVTPAECVRALSDMSFSDDELVYCLHQKERQPNPRAERVFGLTTLRVRTALSCLERNVADKLFPYLPGLLMGVSRVVTSQSLETVSVHRRTVTRYSNLDYEKWCQYKRATNVSYTLEMLDDVFHGASSSFRPYSRIHQLFGSVLYVSSDRSYPPEEFVSLAGTPREPRSLGLRLLKLKQREAAAGWPIGSTTRSFVSDSRGCEGQVQKVWSVDSYGDILSAAYAAGVTKARLLGQGDNVVISVSYTVPASTPVGEERSPNTMAYVAARHDAFKQELIRRSVSTGKPLKPTETWESFRLMLFGKNFVLDGVILPQALKKISRMSEDTGDVVTTPDAAVALIAGASYEAAAASTDPLPSYLCKGIGLALLMVGEMNRNRISGVVRQLKLTEHLPEVPAGERFTTWISALLLMGAPLGFPPTMSIPAHLWYRQHPDPLSTTLSGLQLAAVGGSTVARNLYHWLCSDNRPAAHFNSIEPLLLSPSSVPVIDFEGGEAVLRNEIKRALLGYPVANFGFKEILKIHRSDPKPSSLEELIKMTPHFQPRFASALYSATVEATLEKAIGRFSASSTIEAIGGLSRDGLATMASRADRAFVERLKFVNLAFLNAPSSNWSPPCSTAIALKLRTHMIPGTVVDGVTTPASASQARVSVVLAGDPLPDPATRPCVIITVDHTSSNPVQPAAESPGPNPGYFGSATKTKLVKGLITTDPLCRAKSNAVRLTETCKMLTTHTSGLAAWVNRAILCQSDASLKELWDGVGSRTEGCSWHRLSSPQMDSFATINYRSGCSHRCTITSDTAAQLCRSNEQLMIYFQSWLIQAIGLYTSYCSNKRIDQCEPIFHMIIEPKCKCCLIPAYLGLYDLPDPHLTPIPNALKQTTSPLLRAPATMFTVAWQTEQLRSRLGGVTDYKASGIQAEAAAAYILVSSARIQVPGLYAGRLTGRVAREMPMLRFADLARLNIPRLLDWMAYWIALRHLHTFLLIRAEKAMLQRVKHMLTGAFAEQLAKHVSAPGIESQFRGMADKHGLDYGMMRTQSSVDAILTAELVERLVKALSCQSALGVPCRLCFAGPDITSGDDAEKLLRVAAVASVLMAGRLSADFRASDLTAYAHSDSVSGILQTRNRLIIAPPPATVGAARRLCRVITDHPRLVLSQCMTLDPQIADPDFLYPAACHDEQVPAVATAQFNFRKLVPLHDPHPEERLRIAESILTRYLDEPHEIEPRELSEIRTASAGLHAEHIFKTRGSISSAWQKLLPVMWKERIEPKMAVCVGDGAGSFSALIASMSSSTHVLYGSLWKQTDFVEGKLEGYVPPCIADTSPDLRSKLVGLRESLMSGGDLTLRSTIDAYARIAARHDMTGRVNLITCDAYIAGDTCETTLARSYHMIACNLSQLARLVGAPDVRVIMKAFSSSEEVWSHILAGLTMHFHTVCPIESPLSSMDNTEFYIVSHDLRACPGLLFSAAGVPLTRVNSRYWSAAFPKLHAGAVRTSRPAIIAPKTTAFVIGLTAHMTDRSRLQLAQLLDAPAAHLPDPRDLGAREALVVGLDSQLRRLEDLLVTFKPDQIDSEALDAIVPDRLAKTLQPIRSIASISRKAMAIIVLMALLHEKPASLHNFSQVVSSTLTGRRVVNLTGVQWGLSLSADTYSRQVGRAVAIIYGGYSGLSPLAILLNTDGAREPASRVPSLLPTRERRAIVEAVTALIHDYVDASSLSGLTIADAGTCLTWAELSEATKIPVHCLTCQLTTVAVTTATRIQALGGSVAPMRPRPTWFGMPIVCASSDLVRMSSYTPARSLLTELTLGRRPAFMTLTGGRLSNCPIGYNSYVVKAGRNEVTLHCLEES